MSKRIWKSVFNMTAWLPYPIFTHESSTESVPFLDLRVKLSQGQLETDLHIKPTDRHSIFTILPPILDIPSDQ